MCWGPALLIEVLHEQGDDDGVHVFLKGPPGDLGKASAYVLGQGTADYLYYKTELDLCMSVCMFAWGCIFLSVLFAWTDIFRRASGPIGVVL